MELKKIHLPAQFLERLPEGIKLIKRKGEAFLVIEKLFDWDGNTLLSDAIRIHGEPSVRIKVRIGNSEGFMFIDAYWGSHAKLFGFAPDGSGVVDAFSPATGKSLLTDKACTEKDCRCGKAIEFRLPGAGNKIYVCARLGCPGHHIQIEDFPKRVSDIVSHINFFGEGDPEIFEGI